MKKVIMVLIFMFIMLPTVVNADMINSINMNIYIDNNGDAKVTEIWNATPTEKTEYYHSYYNLGKSTIKNLKVSDTERDYETLPLWNVKGNFDDKCFKCGLHYVIDGVEICWGISEYKHMMYTVEYEITNFVSSLKDSQMVYWTLIPKGHDEFGEVNIEIRSDFAYEDTLDVWGYGNYGGLCYVSNGTIKMKSIGENFPSSEYMTILVKFPEGTFNTHNNIDKNFKYYLKMAEKGAKQYKKVLFYIIITIIFLNVIVYVPLIVMYYSDKNAKKHDCTCIPKEDRKKVKKAEYYREIPCEKDLFGAYYIASKYNLIKNKTNLLGAILLKWLKEKKISIIKSYIETGNYKEDCIQFNFEYDEIEDENEKVLYRYLLNASQNGILKKAEIKKWSQNNYKKIFDYFTSIIENEEKKLLENGDAEKVYLNQKYKYKMVYGGEILNNAIELSGLKKYLKDYTLIRDREAIEVELFEDYLIYAQMFGIAKKVMKRFKGLYPDLIEQSSFESFDNISLLMTCASRGISDAKSAKSIAESGASSYSSGGGGYSSGGGRMWLIWWRRPEWAADKR